jgi:hypothetical protein
MHTTVSSLDLKRIVKCRKSEMASCPGDEPLVVGQDRQSVVRRKAVLVGLRRRDDEWATQPRNRMFYGGEERP